LDYLGAGDERDIENQRGSNDETIPQVSYGIEIDCGEGANRCSGVVEAHGGGVVHACPEGDDLVTGHPFGGLADVPQLNQPRAGVGQARESGRHRRSWWVNDDGVGVMPVPDRPGAELLALYDRALPQVYGYLISRCFERSLAEDLTSETFLAAAKTQTDAPLTVGWLIGVARHKLADHWRWHARQQRLLAAVGGSLSEPEDPWDVELEVMRTREVLAQLAPQHRVALTLRYLDGLSVPEVASILDRTVHATETLLVRARREFRHAYEDGGPYA